MSFWGDSWGDSWGNSWGSIEVEVEDNVGGGKSYGYKKDLDFPLKDEDDEIILITQLFTEICL